LSSAAQIANWTDEFVVEVTAQPLTFPIEMYVEAYSSGGKTIQFMAMVTAQRIV
jgi:hypothetical protein